jgi:hypothetical protein
MTTGTGGTSSGGATPAQNYAVTHAISMLVIAVAFWIRADLHRIRGDFGFPNSHILCHVACSAVWASVTAILAMFVASFMQGRWPWRAAIGQDLRYRAALVMLLLLTVPLFYLYFIEYSEASLLAPQRGCYTSLARAAEVAWATLKGKALLSAPMAIYLLIGVIPPLLAFTDRTPPYPPLPGPQAPLQSRPPGPQAPPQSQPPGPQAPPQSQPPGPQAPPQSQPPGPQAPPQSQPPPSDSTATGTDMIVCGVPR